MRVFRNATASDYSRRAATPGRISSDYLHLLSDETRKRLDEQEEAKHAEEKQREAAK